MKTAAASLRYAKALFGLARDQDALEPVHEDMRALAALLEDSPVFARFTEDPRISPENRGQALDALFRDEAHSLTLRFLAFLDAKDRLDVLPGICRDFASLYRDHRGILLVRITAASALTPDQTAAIEARLHDKFGKQIQSTVHVDPALLGGFKIQAGDTIQDHSIATQLNVLKHKLIHA